MPIQISSEIMSRVSPTIAAGDGMLGPGGTEHYFSVGQSALKNVLNAVTLSGRSHASVERILDYACGYGRVLRWLRAAFPQAYVTGVDADAKAARMASEVTGVPTQLLNVDLRTPIDTTPFDLIWVGSLFTHLPLAETCRVLNFLVKHLATNGIVIFTTHGVLVEQRMATRERLYNITEQLADQLLSDLASSGYGFAPYQGTENYGISVAYPDTVMGLIRGSGLNPVAFSARGWAAHQDVFAANKI